MGKTKGYLAGGNIGIRTDVSNVEETNGQEIKRLKL